MELWCVYIEYDGEWAMGREKRGSGQREGAHVGNAWRRHASALRTGCHFKL